MKKIIIGINILLIGTIFFINGSIVPEFVHQLSRNGYDKIIHFGFFCYLNLSISYLMSKNFTKITISIIILSIVIELLQILFNRSFEFGDIVANSLGSIFAYFIITKFFKGTFRN
jgi:glycopeptide antibiotics resistance protein